MPYSEVRPGVPDYPGRNYPGLPPSPPGSRASGANGARAAGVGTTLHENLHHLSREASRITFQKLEQVHNRDCAFEIFLPQ